MTMPADEAFSRRLHEAVLPVTERYVVESGRPNSVYAAPFDPGENLLDYTQTHFAAQPLPVLTERAGRFVTSKIVGIPKDVLDEVLVPAFALRAAEIIEHRLRYSLIQLADHAPNQLPVATQFAGNLALADRMRGGTRGSRLRGLIRQSNGIGTIGYRPLGIRPIPKGPGILIGRPARWVTNTHYSVPSTEQYRVLGLERDDRKQYNGTFGFNLVAAMQPVAMPQNTSRRVRPAHLNPECVINPVGTKELHQDGRVVIPRAHWATGKLVDGLRAGILPVYTAFRLDERGKVVGGYCEVGNVIPPPEEGEGGNLVDAYLTKLAAFRSEREGHEVVYAEAA